MVLARVMSIKEAYQAVEWKVVFLLAGLIPLGLAMQKTGAALFLAEKVLNLVTGKHLIFLILSVGILSTLFSLFMSNVGAIVVLAPLVINLGELGGFDPRPLALMAAVCAATHSSCLLTRLMHF
jgi:di/tricarboxylate transporter